jgi:hypothetical protein
MPSLRDFDAARLADAAEDLARAAEDLAAAARDREIAAHDLAIAAQDHAIAAEHRARVAAHLAASQTAAGPRVGVLRRYFLAMMAMPVTTAQPHPATAIVARAA